MYKKVLDFSRDINIETRCLKCKVKDNFYGLSDVCDNCGGTMPKTYNSNVTIFALKILELFIKSEDDIKNYKTIDFKLYLLREIGVVIEHYDRNKVVLEEKLKSIRDLIKDSEAFGNEYLGLLYVSKRGEETIYIHPESPAMKNDDLDSIEVVGYIVAAFNYIVMYGTATTETLFSKKYPNLRLGNKIVTRKKMSLNTLNHQ